MIIFLNHHEPRCGVYQMGKRIGGALAEIGVRYFEVNLNGAGQIIETLRPQIIVYNWHQSTIPWAPALVKAYPRIKHVGLIHEISPLNPKQDALLFPYRMICDPNFPSDNKTTFRSVRHIPRYNKPLVENETLTIGSFGFAVGGKLFHQLVALIKESFSEVRVRLHVPFSYYGDNAGSMAASYAETCRHLFGDNSRLDITHDFLAEEALLDWLAQNDLNAFFYEANTGRGLSSTVDYAIAAQRPIAVNDSHMFRHLHAPLGHYPAKRLSDLLDNEPSVKNLYNEWNPDRLVAEYRTMFSILGG